MDKLKLFTVKRDPEWDVSLVPSDLAWQSVQDIYESVASRYPDTDDLTIGVAPPESPEDGQKTWEKCANILEFVAKESQIKAGLELNFSKCHALAPLNILDPTPGTLPEIGWCTDRYRRFL